ncbi:MAG: TENA/THI-4 family protein [Agathobaculum sp.]|uniref:TENA/THI-4 family protein n=1 Tax=Agathobaculum sp. TaxID=2048138 RepID=UPI0025C45572|nr:TENA/THI-4 family protein [Agathobaculum sp.]MCI7125482.1 TENA/THI-4 family protein [Agathobaculum sp.]
MSFVAQCIEDSLPIWASCLSTPFLRGVADGSLPEDCFKGYIVDDSLYLREYSKVFAWGIINARDMEDIRAYYSLLAFVNEAEDTTRLHYLRRYQLTDAQIQPLPLRPENRAYVDYMLDAAKNAPGAAECMMACLPCMLSYGWIFGEIIKRSPPSDNSPYLRFISDYAGGQYDAVCRAWTDFADSACQDLSDARRAHCMEIFRACSQHEYNFWQMSARPRTDI